MLRDITIGQHFPGSSLVHKFDPRLKLVLTIAYIILLFAASNPLGLTLSILFLVAMYAVAKIPFKLILKSLKPILPIILFTAVLNLFFVSGEGDPLVQFWIFKIYAEGVRYAVLMAVRVMALIAGTSLLTYTTSPIVLTDAIEQLLKPLGRLHFPVHELAMMMSIALRFIPTLIGHKEEVEHRRKDDDGQDRLQAFQDELEGDLGHTVHRHEEGDRQGQTQRVGCCKQHDDVCNGHDQLHPGIEPVYKAVPREVLADGDVSQHSAVPPFAAVSRGRIKRSPAFLRSAASRIFLTA